MRRLMVGALALGCLGLFVGTVSVSLQGPVYAQAGDLSYSDCAAIEATFNPCKQAGFVLYCHFNESTSAGRAHCGNENSYKAHVGPGEDIGHSQKDRCIVSDEDKEACESEDPK